jgi:imidazoleglycerol phosphate synthase cyclase subunit
MLAKRIIACLDVKDGRVVKGTRFVNVRDAGDPVVNARRYCDEGVDELVMLDIAATREGREASLQTVASVAATIDIPLTVGGGVRDDDDVARYLEAGADKVAINSAAVADPQIIARCSQRFGAQCIVLSIDAVRTGERYQVKTHGGAVAHPLDALEWALDAQELGAGEILLTAIDRDGTRDGFDLALISRFSSELRVPLVASGGARDAASFYDALEAGADAALGASLFHDGDCSVHEVKRFCRERGVEIRP